MPVESRGLFDPARGMGIAVPTPECSAADRGGALEDRMPIKGILNTAHALSFYTRRQEVQANNLANASSDGFKADRVFAHATNGSPYPVPVQDVDMQQGAFRETARPLDISLDGPGFFVVDTPAGERLTRGGSFALDSAGRLTDGSGNLVLGTEDGPLLVQGGTVEIHADGELTVDGAHAGRLRIVEPEQPGQLLKEGLGRFVAGGPLRAAGAETRVRQGAVEDANLDPTLAMVDLVTIQRAFSANMDALKAMDGVLGSITNDVGKV
jgi:flagellar basal-body rod protein FlgF